jgi:hypothetical protein
MLKLVALCSLLLPVIARAQPVTSFEPSAPVLPANTLRFYFTFDRPARSEVHQQDIQLLDSGDRPLVDVFMDFGQELWSPDGKRLTVLFDPGKVKRGVEAPGSQLTPLTAGQTYTIALGNFRNVFRVGQPVRTRVDPRLWAVTSNSRNVSVRFDRVMDAALVEDQLGIEDESRRPVPCVVRVIDGGNAATCKFARPLKKGRYVMTVGERIEDVAGNRMNEALDHATTEKISEPHSAELWFFAP